MITKHLLFASLALLVLTGLDPASVLTAQSTEKAETEIRDQFEKLKELVKEKAADKALKLMTPAGRDSFLLDPVVEGLLMCGEELEIDAEADFEDPIENYLAARLRSLRKLAAKHDLDKLEGFSVEDFEGVLTIEDHVALFESLRESIREKFSKSEDLPQISQEFREELPSFMTPQIFKGEIDELEVDNKHAHIAVRSKMEFPAIPGVDDFAAGEDIEMEMLVPPTIVDFCLVDGQWLYAGVNMEKTQQRMEEMFEGMVDFGALNVDDMSFEGSTIEDKKLSLDDYRGKVVLIDFWGTWCGPCVQALPRLKQLHDAFHAHGFEIVGIANDGKRELREFLEENKLPWENIVDGEGSLAEKFGVSAFPTTLLVDQEGNHVGSELRSRQLVEKIGELLDIDEQELNKIRDGLKTNLDHDDRSEDDEDDRGDDDRSDDDKANKRGK